MSVTTSTAAAGARNVVAVLGPTNTGKTHLAIERMLGHASGVIGLPLRLLAREVYDRVVDRVGADAAALITGEEKIAPPNARYRICTVEAMPSGTDAAFLAIDEIQLAGDLERGHVFTDRILNLRGREETLLLGAATMRGIIERLVPRVNVVTRPRMSVLAYSGARKITRLKRRSAIIAFSAEDVYAIAELVRRQRGGAAVVLGSLSPRTRNAQVELFQSGDVDFLVATDAIGMGLNLDLDHVAFASDRKFDGFQFRRLTAVELGQIAGRAGRHMRDGTFGVTGRVEPFEDELVTALETHQFEPVKTVQWRNRDLDFASLDALRASLDVAPSAAGLTKAPLSEDVAVLEILSRDPSVRDMVDGPRRCALLWDVCQIPDYRKIARANHADLIASLFRFLATSGRIDEEWFADQVAYADRTDGDIDTLANRIAHIRTWTYAANRPEWLADPAHWQERTRSIEDRLSDALHERLTGRFVDRRTSVLMRGLKEKSLLDAEITASGEVLVEGQHVGGLAGFRFTPDPNAGGPDGRALKAAAQRALAGEIAQRAERAATAANGDFVLASDGTLRWQGAAIARLAEGDDPLKPRLILLADDLLAAASRERVQGRLDLWLAGQGETLLQPLFDLRQANDLPPAARGIAFRLAENFGVIDRSEIAEEVRGLDQAARAGMRGLGVRFGAYHIYVPQLLKPAANCLLAMFWALKNGGLEQPGVAELTLLAASGRTTLPLDPSFAAPLYRVVGYRIAGQRAVRVDILERLADLIRPLVAWRPTPEAPEPPPGAVPGSGFTVTVAMTSLLGCSGEDFASVLRSLGYRLERRPVATQAAAADPASSIRPDEPASSVHPDEDAPARAAAPADEDAADAASANEPDRPAGDADGATTETALAPAPPPSSAEDQAMPATEAAGEPQVLDIWRIDRRRPKEEPRQRHGEGADGARRSSRRPDKRGRDPRPLEGRRERGVGRKAMRGGEREPVSEQRRPTAQDRPRRTERPIDPDSPFAALAALKAELEERSRKD